MSNVAIIGGCGRLGLRISLISANKGHNVTSIDIDEERINEIKQGCLPFIEHEAEIYLEQALKKKTLTLTTNYDLVAKAEVVIITIGTPVDSNLNPSLEPVAGVIFDLAEYFKENQLIVFRNTLAPGIVGRIKTLIEDKTGLKVGKNIYLAFAPEITDETPSIHDTLKTPQPIGAYDENSFNVASKFFKTLTKGKLNWVTPEEALLGKLMKNMYTYIQNACANEFYLIAESYGVNIHKILDALRNETNQELQIPNPNLNAAGPGMHKEGWFLVDRVPFTELVTTAFKINESIPAQVVQKLENYKLNKVVILGMSNKPNSDDPRSSLSYKLRKLLYYKDYVVGCYDPYLPEYADSSVLSKADAVILMTGHKEFEDLKKITELVNNSNCIYVDINGFWEETRSKATNGILKLNGKVKKA
ncbi:MAG: nucleotide sugar dehydrogenase [Candidatus Melainabacteria bacterium]|nr:nucleotide sugar dehydrogenase [Candidatus Melainabacteria bacterium]